MAASQRSFDDDPMPPAIRILLWNFGMFEIILRLFLPAPDPYWNFHSILYIYTWHTQLKLNQRYIFLYFIYLWQNIVYLIEYSVVFLFIRNLFFESSNNTFIFYNIQGFRYQVFIFFISSLLLNAKFAFFVVCFNFWCLC